VYGLNSRSLSLPPRVIQISTAVSALREGNTRVTLNLGFALLTTAVSSSTLIRRPETATFVDGSSVFASSRRNTTALPVTQIVKM
jgi:hypothetical protein